MFAPCNACSGYTVLSTWRPLVSSSGGGEFPGFTLGGGSFGGAAGGAGADSLGGGVLLVGEMSNLIFL